MPRAKKKSKKCRYCVHLYTDLPGKDSCWFSEKVTNPDKKACKQFKPGTSFIPRIAGRLSKLVKFDAEKVQSWTFYTDDDQCLILTWVPRDWSWKIQMVGISKKGGLITKKFSPDLELAAFIGRVEVMGVGENSLYTSANHNDPDDHDEDECVVNKPKEVRVYPIKPNKRESDS